MTTPRTLTADELADLATANPTHPSDRARLRFAAGQLGHTDAALPLIRARLATSPSPNRPPSTLARAVDLTNTGDVADRSRDLGAGDVAWLDTLPTDPAKVDPADARRLARLAREVRTEVDRALIGPRVAALREHHAKKARLLDAERALSTAPRAVDPSAMTDWSSWRSVIEEAARAEVPDLTPAEASTRACDLVAARVAERRDAIADARRRLADVVSTTGLPSELLR